MVFCVPAYDVGMPDRNRDFRQRGPSRRPFPNKPGRQPFRDQRGRTDRPPFQEGDRRDDRQPPFRGGSQPQGRPGGFRDERRQAPGGERRDFRGPRQGQPFRDQPRGYFIERSHGALPSEERPAVPGTFVPADAPRGAPRDARAQPPQQLPRGTSWESAAGWYDQVVGQDGSFFQQEVVFPGVLKLLGNVRGKRVLDLACGQGGFCRILAEQGATVTGVELSPSLVELAKKRSPRHIRYVQADARDLAPLKGETFDAITCILAVQNMDVIEPVFQNCAGMLRLGSPFVIVMNHPSFRIPRQSGWGWDDERKLQYRRVDRYLSELKIPIQTHPGAAPLEHTWTFHRALQDYVRTLSKAGFVIDALEEWTSPKHSGPGPRARGENLARDEFPMFLALKAVRR